MVISARHEIRLRARGAVEYSVATTRLLLAMIVLYEVSCIAEGSLSAVQLDVTSLIGIGLVGESVLVLYLLIRALGELYTVKVLIAPSHQRVRSAIYDRLRHPIYFFVLIPEWIGMGLAMHAWIAMAAGLPVLLVLLLLRIRQEEAALRAKFPEYRGLLLR